MTKGRLEMAKWQATALFEEGLSISERAFRNYALRKYRCKPQQIKFDTRGALRRIRAASLSDEFDDRLGQTDGKTIEIMSIPMSHPELVGVILHEGLHDWCKVRGKSMSADNEHACMSRVGDELF